MGGTVLNQAGAAFIDHSWVPLSAWRRLQLLEPKRVAPKKTDVLDDVPVMSATVLGLDMLLHEPCIDLRMASELILSDVGATIHILSLIGREYEAAADRPGRMGDCIASLDVDTWFNAISARTLICDAKHSTTTSLWKHCRLIAQYAQLVAESLDGICPEDAYLVGLLHDVDAIPAALGWSEGGGGFCTMESSLPLFVLAATRVVNDCCPSSTWRFILTAAHELAGAELDFAASIPQPPALRLHPEELLWATGGVALRLSLISH